MKSKCIKAIILSVILFISGITVSIMGICRGQEWAVLLSKPKDAVSWSIPREMILYCEFVPTLLGLCLVLLSMVFFAVIFIKWMNKN